MVVELDDACVIIAFVIVKYLDFILMVPLEVMLDVVLPYVPLRWSGFYSTVLAASVVQHFFSSRVMFSIGWCYDAKFLAAFNIGHKM